MVHVTALQILTSNTVVRGTRKNKQDGTKEENSLCGQILYASHI